MGIFNGFTNPGPFKRYCDNPVSAQCGSQFCAIAEYCKPSIPVFLLFTLHTKFLPRGAYAENSHRKWRADKPAQSL